MGAFFRLLGMIIAAVIGWVVIILAVGLFVMLMLVLCGADNLFALTTTITRQTIPGIVARVETTFCTNTTSALGRGRSAHEGTPAGGFESTSAVHSEVSVYDHFS